jgi:hypothetical protein
MSPPVREGLWAPSGSQASEGLISALAPLTWPHAATGYAVNRLEPLATCKVPNTAQTHSYRFSSSVDLPT